MRISNFLFPQTCLLCANANGGSLGLCTACDTDLPWHTKTTQCPQCALPTQLAQTCGRCLSDTPAFESVHALFRYEYPLDQLLHQFKYQRAFTIAELFAEHILTRLPNASLPDVIIPMPLHPTRLNERTFNQATEMARIAAKRLNTSIDFQNCVRNRLTTPQAQLPLKDRAKNIKDAFTFNGTLDHLKVAIIDDVMTSGASLNELAKTLKIAGAASVECWVVARTLLD